MATGDNKEQEQDKRNKAYDLRLRGYSFRQIATAMHVSVGTAHRWVSDYMSAVSLPLVDEVRKQEVDRMQRYLLVLDARIDEGDEKAVTIAIKVSERLCKMLGIDAPQQISVEKTEVTQLDLSIRDLIASQDARNAERKAQAAALREEGVSDSMSDTVEQIVLEN